MRSANPILIGVWIFVVVSLVGCAKRATEGFDILIKNGKIVDGTGTPGYQGDIGIIDDTIVEIGDLARKSAVKTIDAQTQAHRRPETQYGRASCKPPITIRGLD